MGDWGGGGRYQQIPVWSPTRALRQFLVTSDIYFYLFIFSPNIKIIYSAYEWGWRVKIQSSPNLRDQKRKISPFSSQLLENQKLYNVSKNQPLKSIRRGNMRFPIFWTLKSAVPPLSPLQIELGSWILVCTFSKNPRCVFWGSQLFSLISPPHSLNKLFFWLFFLIFWVCSSHNSPSNWTRNLKLGMYI